MRTLIRLSSVLPLLCLWLFSSLSNIAVAKDESSSRQSYAYIALDPDIITNYAGDNSTKLGYLKLTIEIMLDNTKFIADIEHHMPLLRATAIEVIGRQSEQQVKSLSGREQMRREILKRFRVKLLQETGNEAILDIIFTKYLRQGG